MKIVFRNITFIASFFAATLTFLVIYSYTKVDLNLTLSAQPLYQSVQQKLTYVGYFNRPLSATIFLLLIGALFGVYIVILKKITQGWRTSHVWWLVTLSLILLFAYPAFSHDLFNYMFDAQIVTKYGLNPSFFKALDFPDDSWIRFMRWTHRYYPYGPGWLLFTLIPSFLGMGKFVVTLFLFKLMFALFHVLNCLLIYKIARHVSKENATFSVTFYAFNPLVLTESLVSPHNETVMLTLALISFYLLIRIKVAASMMLLIASVSIKYVSALFIPLLWWKKPTETKFYQLGYWLWLLLLVPLVLSREPYPWYFVPLVAFASLAGSKWIQLMTLGGAAALLIRYWPFLLRGEYSTQTMALQRWGMGIGFVAVFIFFLWLWRKE